MVSEKRKIEPFEVASIGKKRRYQYSNQELQDALRRMWNGENKHHVSRKSNIPYSTIRKKLRENCNSELHTQYFPIFLKNLVTRKLKSYTCHLLVSFYC